MRSIIKTVSIRLGGVALGMWIAMLLTALSARILSALSDPVIVRDGVTFLSIARAAREEDPGVLLRQDQHPGFPALAALLYPVIGDWEITGLAISIAAGALTVIPIVLLGARVAGPLAGVLGGWVFAVARYPVHYTSWVVSDGLHGFFFASAAWAAAVLLGLDHKEEPGGVRRKLGPAWSFFLAGLFPGLAYLVRPEGLVMAASTAAACAVKVLSAREAGNLRRLLKGSGLFALGLLITVGPYAGHLSIEAGTFRLTRKKPILQTISSTELRWEEPSSRGAAPSSEPPQGLAGKESSPVPGSSQETAAPQTIRVQPTAQLPLRLKGVLLAIAAFFECLGFIPSGLLAIALLHRRLSRRSLLPEVLLLAPILLFVVLLSGVYLLTADVARRHLYPAALVQEGLLGLGFIGLGGFLATFRPESTILYRAASVLTALLVLAMIPKSAGFIPDSGRGKDLWLRDTGLSLRGTIDSSDLVFAPASLSRIAFYSGGRYLWEYAPRSRDTELPWLCAEASRHGARWLILSCLSFGKSQEIPPGWSMERNIFNDKGEVRLYRNR